MRLFFLLAFLTGCGGSTSIGSGNAASTLDPALGLPSDLKSTGLYRDWDSHEIDPANVPYTPGFTLWSDGAEKSRWVRLPPGAQIDVSQMDEWVFPIGTIFWKEFRLDLTAADGQVQKGARVETRIIWKRAEGDWEMGTYLWSADETRAELANSLSPPPVPYPGSATYEVPVGRCHKCHDLRGDKVLGFEAILLASPEADQNGMTWAALTAENRVRSDGSLPDASELEFLGGADITARRALGYLHANCGITCHHANSGEATPFFMRLEWGEVGPMPLSLEETNVFRTAVNVRSRFTPHSATGEYFRVHPSDVTRSTLSYRMHVRNGLLGGGEQMPPIDSHMVDADGVALIDDWIRTMNDPAPAP